MLWGIFAYRIYDSIHFNNSSRLFICMYVFYPINSTFIYYIIYHYDIDVVLRKIVTFVVSKRISIAE